MTTRFKFRLKVLCAHTNTDPHLPAIIQEDWANHLIPDADGFGVDEEGLLLLLDRCGNFAYCPEGRFDWWIEIDMRLYIEGT